MPYLIEPALTSRSSAWKEYLKTSPSSTLNVSSQTTTKLKPIDRLRQVIKLALVEMLPKSQNLRPLCHSKKDLLLIKLLKPQEVKVQTVEMVLLLELVNHSPRMDS